MYRQVIALLTICQVVKPGLISVPEDLLGDDESCGDGKFSSEDGSCYFQTEHKQQTTTGKTSSLKRCLRRLTMTKRLHT
jgi:hypothetical protein